MNFPIGFAATHDIVGFNSKENYHAKSAIKNPNSTLPKLPEDFGEEAVQRSIGRLDGVQEEKVLQSDLHGRINDRRGCDVGRLAKPLDEAQRGSVQLLRDFGEFACSSHGQQPSEQLIRELENAMRVLPCEVALGTWEEPNEASEVLPVLRQASEEERSMQHTCESDVQTREPINGSWWDTEPNIGRVANGIKNRVGQLKGYGNAQVPLQAAAAWKLLGGE